MLGVILPPRASFTPEDEETLEIISGDCRVRLGEEGEWQILSGGRECQVSAGCRCETETDQPVYDVRHVETAFDKESGSPP